MKDRSILIAFTTALLLHIIIATLLLMNVNFSFIKAPPKNQAPIINATIVNQKLFDDLAQRKNEKKQAEKKKIEEEKQRIQQEKQKAEEQRREKEEQRVQAQKEAERISAEKVLAEKKLKAQQKAKKAKKIADDKRKQQQAEQARKIADEKRKQQQAEQARKIADEKRKQQQAEQARKIAEEKRQKIEAAAKVAKAKAEQEKERLRRAELDKQMDAQFEDAFSSAQSSKQLSEIARYQALIQNKISRNWQVEPSMKGKSCTLAIRLAPDGLVISVTRSSGDIKLCESAKRAALKATTLPIPKDPDISAQFRDFDIKLEPDF